MTLIHAYCIYEPDHHNQATGRQGQWRVKTCLPTLHNNDFVVPVGKLLCVLSTKKYPRGCIIRPHKELNRVLESQLPPRNPILDEIGKKLGMERGRWERDGNFRSRLKARVAELQQLNEPRRLAA